jgi:hypothetical protein
MGLQMRNDPMPCAAQNRSAASSDAALAAPNSASRPSCSRRGNRVIAVAVVVRNLMGCAMN